ncbi:OmpA family protein [Mongoliitalea daihaiensis]|uniref:OmpA family protein n=1 Tax=Mongoliitalea daihaiensis TaxID=2782006 RepID=UPI001F1F53E2|nr:OmpA family protein [Mongoliitalea daihaiensis]UJP64260.1 OmpA family protein [Mongoliitalea daihaiensis]
MIKIIFSYVFKRARGIFPLAFLFSGLVMGQEFQSLKVLNSPYDEKQPVLAPDGTLYFSVGFHPENVGGFKDYGDIWMSSPAANGEWSSPVRVHDLSTEGNDVIIGFPDILTVFVYHSEGTYGRGIHQYTKFGSSWNYLRRLSIENFKPEGSYFSGRLDATNTLMLLSFQQQGGYGNEDLYIIRQIREGVWSNPQNLGEEINSFAQEQGPYLSDNQEYMFFSSNKSGNGRGKDIYVTQRLDSTWSEWATPKPLKLASTQGSDLYYLPLQLEEKKAIFSTTQNSEGFGDFVLVTLEMEDEIFAENMGRIKNTSNSNVAVAIDVSEKDSVSNRVVQEEGADLPKTDDFNEKSTGKFIQVLDLNELTPLTYQLTLIGKRGEKVTLAKVSEIDSMLSNSVWESILIQSASYIPKEVAAESWNELDDYTFYLSKAAPGNSLVLNNIQFNVGTADFADSRSIQVLDNLLEFLNENPTIKIRFEGHTDNYGDPMLNKELSLKRASKIRAYLTLHGVEFERVRISGWGGTRPRADNSTEEGRQLNRRVEMLIEK